MCGAVSATSYTNIYVSPTGDDSYDGGNSSHPAKTIQHALEVTKDNGSTIHLANGVYNGVKNTKITLDKNMTIKGQSESGTIINGTGTNWIFSISNGANVKIINLTLANGTQTRGGAISNQGNLTVTGCTFTGNTATKIGGAIYSFGNLTIINSKFTGNTAAEDGGAIYNSNNCVLTATSSTFTGNTAAEDGGAISNHANSIITSSTFTSNRATGKGGAIFNQDVLTVTGSTFTGNTADDGGGAINNAVTSTIINSKFTSNTAGNRAGAILNGNTLTVTGSTFTGNTATSMGGAIVNYKTLTATDNTFTGNNAATGGAITMDGSTANINFNRIAGNTASYDSAICNYGGTMNAEFNWWGSNAGPSGLVSGVTISKWLVLTIKAASSSVQTNSNLKITTDLKYDNSGILHTEAYLPNGIPVSFTTSLGTISSSSTTVNGVAQSTLKSGKLGSANVLTKLDNQTLNTLIKIIDTVSPKVTSTYPKKNAKKVSKTKTIIIKFSEKIKKSSKWSKIYIKNKYGKVKITKKWVSGNKLYIKTKKRISKKYYTVYIPASAVKDYAGNKLAKKYTYKFKTRK